MGDHRRRRDEEGVNIAPHLMACILTAFFGLLLHDGRIVMSAMLTGVGFVATLALIASFFE